MGLDLSVSPDFWGVVRGERFQGHLAYTRLAFERDSQLFEAITRQGAVLVDYKVEWYDDNGLETITTDAYGTPLTLLYPRHFAKVLTWALKYQASRVNVATLTYLASLPEDTPVVLYWH